MATYMEELQEAKMASLDRLASWIAAEQLTNNIVCNKAGLSNSAIFYANKNKSGVSLKMADKICEAFPRLNKMWLLYGTGEMYNHNVSENNITAHNPQHSNVNQFGSHNKLGDIQNVTADLKSIEQLTQAILNQQDITKKAQEQSDRLIAIIEKLQQ